MGAITPNGEDKKSDRTRSQRSRAEQQNKTAKLAQHEGKQGKFGSLSGHYSGLDELTQYFLSGRFRPSNVVLFLWCALLAFYTIKAFQFGFGFEGYSAYYCPLGDFFGGVFAGIGFIMALSIADFIGLEELLGGTWVFVGGPFAWIFIKRLETKIALRKYMPNHQQIMEEMKNLKSDSKSTSVNQQEVVRKLIQQNMRADEAKQKTSMVGLKGVFKDQGTITAVLLFWY